MLGHQQLLKDLAVWRLYCAFVDLSQLFERPGGLEVGGQACFQQLLLVKPLNLENILDWILLHLLFKRLGMAAVREQTLLSELREALLVAGLVTMASKPLSLACFDPDWRPGHPELSPDSAVHPQELQVEELRLLPKLSLPLLLLLDQIFNRHNRVHDPFVDNALACEVLEASAVGKVPSLAFVPVEAEDGQTVLVAVRAIPMVVNDSERLPFSLWASEIPAVNISGQDALLLIAEHVVHFRRLEVMHLREDLLHVWILSHSGRDLRFELLDQNWLAMVFEHRMFS